MQLQIIEVQQDQIKPLGKCGFAIMPQPGHSISIWLKNKRVHYVVDGIIHHIKRDPKRKMAYQDGVFVRSISVDPSNAPQDTAALPQTPVVQEQAPVVQQQQAPVTLGRVPPSMQNLPAVESIPPSQLPPIREEPMLPAGIDLNDFDDDD